MKYNWPKVIDEFRKIVKEGVSFVGPEHAAEFRFELRETDRFHPWNSDDMLDRALSRMPSRCDYRSLKSYWAWRDGRYAIENALDEMLFEVEEIIRDYYLEPRNFAPGYILPTEVCFAWESRGVTPRMVARILRAAKMP